MSKMQTEELYLAGGCLWGVQEFVRHLPGVISTEAGRANGSSQTLDGEYDGYVECVRVHFDCHQVSVADLAAYLFEIIDPYSLDQQGPDVGKKYRSGIYSRDPKHLEEARCYIKSRSDCSKVVVEVLTLSNYIRSDEKHQDRLQRYPKEACHIPKSLLHKYKCRSSDD
jgi:peptide-methionine (S)-S-oxide reductase